MEFGVDDTNRNDAGFFMAGGVSAGDRDRESSLMNAPPGMGDDQEKEDDSDYEEQRKSQVGARVADRSSQGFDS